MQWTAGDVFENHDVRKVVGAQVGMFRDFINSSNMETTDGDPPHVDEEWHSGLWPLQKLSGEKTSLLRRRKFMCASCLIFSSCAERYDMLAVGATVAAFTLSYFMDEFEQWREGEVERLVQVPKECDRRDHVFRAEGGQLKTCNNSSQSRLD